VKWEYELRNAEQLEAVVDRALSIAATEPRGPVYLSLPREVIAAPIRTNNPNQAAHPGARRAEFDAIARSQTSSPMPSGRDHSQPPAATRGVWRASHFAEAMLPVAQHRRAICRCRPRMP